MDAPRESFYKKEPPSLMADVREAMSRHGDFGPTPEHFANDVNIFEFLATLEALEVDGEVLA